MPTGTCVTLNLVYDVIKGEQATTDDQSRDLLLPCSIGTVNWKYRESTHRCWRKNNLVKPLHA